VKAQQWQDLVRAIRSSANSHLDELILIRRNDDNPALHRPLRGLKLLCYDTESDILASAAYKNASKFNPEAKPFVPSMQQASVPTPEEVSDDESIVDEPLNETVQDVEIEVSPIDPSVYRTENEINAIERLQRLYRRRLAIKSKVNSEVDRIRSLMYAESQIESNKLEVSRDYRHVFLGPLPHVLTALQGCQKGIHKTKIEFKKRLRNGKKNFNIDREDELITACKYVPEGLIPYTCY
jgi:hypothetical protein